MANGKLTVDEKKELFLKALDLNLGNITKACESTSIVRQSVYYWMSKDQDFAKEVRERDRVEVDFASAKLHQRINGIKYDEVTYEAKKGEVIDATLPLTKQKEKLKVVKIVEKYIPPDVAAAIYLLKTKGKRFGYGTGYETEKTNKDEKGGVTINIEEIIVE